MKISALIFALGVVATASASLDASAASNYYLNTRDRNAAATCAAQGGSVQTDAAGRALCVFQQQACAAVNMPYLVNPSDPYAAQNCAAACGSITLNASGQQVCVRNSNMREPPNMN
jgi:hypothetical protein